MPSGSTNRLLASVSTKTSIGPDLESVTLGVRKYLERSSRRIAAVYFPEGDPDPLLQFNPTANRPRSD
jgi:hypothetical protein